VTLAFMDRWRRVHFQQWSFDPGGAGIVPEAVRKEGLVLAVDGPQGLSAKGRRMREAERLLRAAGKSGAEMPKPGTAPYAGFISGSVSLFASLRAAGWGLLGEASYDDTALLEVYPGDLFSKWAGYKLPKKTLPAGRRERHDLLRGMGLEFPLGPDAITHDQLDAAAAAYAAYLWATGKAKLYGEPPVWDEEAGVLREGFIASV
jgi:predicted nuclease with RNAse H fold